MNKLNIDSMSRDELAHYIIARPDTLEAREARRTFIRRMAEKTKFYGINLYKTEV